MEKVTISKLKNIIDKEFNSIHYGYRLKQFQKESVLRMLKEVHNDAIELASQNFEGNLEIIDTEANYKFDQMKLKEGKDYEIGFSRSSITNLKIK